MSHAPGAPSGKGASWAVWNGPVHWPAAVVMVKGIDAAAEVKLEPCAEEVVCVGLWAFPSMHLVAIHIFGTIP